jgi:hypothetical protein
MPDKKSNLRKILDCKAGLGSENYSFAALFFGYKKTAEFLQQLYLLFSVKNYTLKRKCMTSPSFTMYSFPSTLNFPASFTFASEP